MFILIFDTTTGLCNQFYDIVNGINFCLKHNITFTFRYCAFRNKNLTSWKKKPFNELFDTSFLNQYKLYIDYNTIKDDITNENCFNKDGNLVGHQFLKEDDILGQLTNLNKKYIVIPQIWWVYKFRDFVDNTIFNRILPSKHLMDRYVEIKNTVVNDQQYNFIHYRYEHDFKNYFNLTIESLDSVLKKVRFKEKNLKIFIATSNIHKLINLKNPKYNKLLYKDDNLLLDLNYEQCAFIDYMFGLGAQECYGHKNSSFSVMLNTIKNTENYYNLI